MDFGQATFGLMKILTVEDEDVFCSLLRYALTGWAMKLWRRWTARRAESTPAGTCGAFTLPTNQFTSFSLAATSSEVRDGKLRPAPNSISSRLGFSPLFRMDPISG